MPRVSSSMSGGTDTEAPPKPPKSLARDESLARCFLSLAGRLRALVDGAGEHAAQLGLGRLAHLHVAALHHQPLEIHEVLGRRRGYESAAASRRNSSTTDSSVRCSSAVIPTKVRPKSWPFPRALTHLTCPGSREGETTRPSRTSTTTRAWACGGSSSLDTRAPRMLRSVR